MYVHFCFFFISNVCAFFNQNIEENLKQDHDKQFWKNI